MKILPKHFEGRDTYILGRFIHNGCQTFTIDKFDAICAKYKVPNGVKLSAIAAYEENSKVEEDYEALFTSTVSDDTTRLLCIANGYNVEVFKDSKRSEEREAVVYSGHDPSYFKDDEDWRVRVAVIKAGYDPAYFKDDPDCDVRVAVIKAGYDIPYFPDGNDYEVCIENPWDEQPYLQFSYSRRHS